MRHMDIKFQTALNSIGSLVLLGGQWIISIFIVRVNGYETAGVFSLAMSIANVFSTIANYGLRNYQLTDIKRIRKQRQYVMMRLLSSVIAFTICLVYMHGGDYNQKEIWAVMFYLLYNISIVFSDSLMTSIQLENHLECNGYSNIFRGCLCLALFLVTLIATNELIPSLGIMALGSFAILILYDIAQYRRYTEEERETIHNCLRGGIALYREGLPMVISAIIPMIITAYPRTVLRSVLDAERLGYYSSVFSPASILSTMISPALIAFLPSLSVSWREKKTRMFVKNILVTYGIVSVITVFAIIGSILLGRFVLVLLYGVSISKYAYLLNYSILAVGISCICICGHNTMVAVGEKKKSAFFYSIALVLTLVLSKWMIATFGLNGTLYVQIIAYGIQAAIQLLFLIIVIMKHFKHETFFERTS